MLKTDIVSTGVHSLVEKESDERPHRTGYQIFEEQVHLATSSISKVDSLSVESFV